MHIYSCGGGLELAPILDSDPVYIYMHTAGPQTSLEYMYMHTIGPLN